MPADERDLNGKRAGGVEDLDAAVVALVGGQI